MEGGDAAAPAAVVVSEEAPATLWSFDDYYPPSNLEL
jgi:hypothetical protein